MDFNKFCYVNISCTPESKTVFKTQKLKSKLTPSLFILLSFKKKQSLLCNNSFDPLSPEEGGVITLPLGKTCFSSADSSDFEKMIFKKTLSVNCHQY